VRVQPLLLQSMCPIAGDVLCIAHVLACYKQGPVRIANVAPGGPANREGLEVGDLLLEVNGIPVLERPLLDIMTIVRGKAGSTVELVIRIAPKCVS
jgi:C-terminal processing protease CtpA/Prc